MLQGGVASRAGAIESSAMPEVAYLFERFPSFGQTFCYREVAELERPGASLHLFSIRRPVDEPVEAWSPRIVERVHYLPEEKALVPEVDAILRTKALPQEVQEAIQSWGRQSDFLRLYQAVYVGTRLKEKGVRHVHAHFAGMAARTAYWIERFFGIPYSFTAHANDIFAPREFVISLAKLMESAAAIVTVSDYAARHLKERFPASSAKVQRIYNGIDVSRFQPTDPAEGVPAIISIGRLIEKKGFGDLISACELLRSHGRAFRCSIIGEGPLEESLRTQIATAGLVQQVELTGPQTQEQIATRLGRGTMFVLPCVRDAEGGMDNLPTVIMEAMAAGLPIISTPLAGIPEMVEPGLNGELVPEHDPAALASAIERFMDDPGRARAMGERGRQIAREKFSIETSAQQLRKLFELA
jgi:colanic acid/amylovoran biosynthesis glycosyltransferase